MIKGKDILRFINDKSIDLSKEELERIIDEELEKPENEMDADLIEYCLDAINEIKNNTQIEFKAERMGGSKKKIVKHKFRRAFAVAATIAILAVCSLSVYAGVSGESVFDGLVEIYNKYIVVRFDKSDDKADTYELLGTQLAQELKDNGIYPVLLPEALLSGNTKITGIEYQYADGIVTANINFIHKKEKGYLSIDCYDSGEFVGESEYPNAQNIAEIKVNGISVYVFEQNGKGSIVYKDGNYQYDIFSSISYEQAIELAKTIK